MKLHYFKEFLEGMPPNPPIKAAQISKFLKNISWPSPCHIPATPLGRRGNFREYEVLKYIPRATHC